MSKQEIEYFIYIFLNTLQSKLPFSKHKEIEHLQNRVEELLIGLNKEEQNCRDEQRAH